MGDTPDFEGDDITGLSAADKRIMVRTFRPIKADVAKHGERLFTIFFTKYPQHQNSFRQFKGKPLSDIIGTPKLIAHGTNVIGTIESLVLSLDKPEVLVELCKKVGYSHGRWGVKPPALDDLKVAIVTLFSEVLQDVMTDEVADTWTRALDVILPTVGQGMTDFYEKRSS